MARANWVVSVASEHDDPLILGPYSQTRAEQLAAAINRASDARPESESLGDFCHATAFPLPRPRTLREAVAITGLGS